MTLVGVVGVRRRTLKTEHSHTHKLSVRTKINRFHPKIIASSSDFKIFRKYLNGNICGPTGLHVTDKLVKVLGVYNTNIFNGISRSTLEAYRIESVARVILVASRCRKVP